MSTALSGLTIFRNAAVRNRTSHSDFHFSDLRGMRDPRDGKFKPVTVYLSINMVDAQALNPITAIFIELMSNFLLANPPGAEHHGQKLGECPVLFVLDEMPKMQKMQAVIQGPDLGRGQKISYLLIGQDLNQIAEKYGHEAADIIISTTAAKIVMRQNDPKTAERFSSMMGMKMKKEKGGDGKEVTKESLLYTPMDIMKMAADKQLVIFQGWYHRPIEADKQMAYKDPRLSKLMAMGEAPPLPEFLVASHHRALGFAGTPKIYYPATKEIKVLSE
jgi:type IV secretory pathway TraG/TraD family ATPase VirD4